MYMKRLMMSRSEKENYVNNDKQLNLFQSINRIVETVSITITIRHMMTKENSSKPKLKCRRCNEFYLNRLKLKIALISCKQLL